MSRGKLVQTQRLLEGNEEQILSARMCELSLSLKGTFVEECIGVLYQELAAKDLRFRPHLWLSDEWFSPSGIPGIAVPFYLAHPRLMQLEQKQMFEVEGGSRENCLKILRHEAGHAIEAAFCLRRRKSRQQMFGKSSHPYPTYYSPRPYSKKYVLHLDSWYAQSHPDEDFAETFAVWLSPDSDWKTRYRGWPALKKLEFMETLMGSIAGTPALVRDRTQVGSLSTIKKSLKQHYNRKRKIAGLDHPHFYDRDLRRLFSENSQNMTASAFLRKIRRKVRKEVARWTGEYQYTIDCVIEDMIERSQKLNLKLNHSAERTEKDFLILLTVQTMNYLHSGRHRVAL